MVVAQGNLRKARKANWQRPIWEHTPCAYQPEQATAKTRSSQRLPASQHLFPLLYLNNQVSELGRAFLPRGREHSPPQDTQAVVCC